MAINYHDSPTSARIHTISDSSQNTEYFSEDFWLDSGNNADIIVLFVSTIFKFVEFMCRTPQLMGGSEK